jgi:hypothetical protein
LPVGKFITVTSETVITRVPGSSGRLAPGSDIAVRRAAFTIQKRLKCPLGLLLRCIKPYRQNISGSDSNFGTFTVLHKALVNTSGLDSNFEQI